MRVLIAEDDPVSRRILEKTLGNWDHSTTSAEDGNLAWALFRAGDYDVVISDWMMPGLDGLDFCRRIRRLKRGIYCYFILLTAKVGRKDYFEGMEAGVDDYLTKPLDPDELRVRIRVAERILNLQAEIQTLQGVLPICAWCRKIRSDEKIWSSAEDYIRTHTAADFTHTICPECSRKQEELP